MIFKRFDKFKMNYTRLVKKNLKVFYDLPKNSFSWIYYDNSKFNAIDHRY